MALAYAPFYKRLRKIVKDHQRMQTGVAHVMRDDGLIVARPRVYNPKFPLRGLVLLFGAAFFFKGYIFAALGSSVYETRVAELAQGTWIERAGAWIMHPDAATLAVANLLTSIGV